MFGDDDGKRAKKDSGGSDEGRDVVSVVGAGMEVEGDCRCEGSLRVDGRVLGTIRAGKSVVVGEGGEVEGGIHTQDAVVAGRVSGTIHAESRVELKEGCMVEGDIHTPSVRLEEGGKLDGELDMSGEGGGSVAAAGRGDSGGRQREGAAAEASDGADSTGPKADQ